MPKQSNQKARILIIRNYLLENTDQNHNASTKEISDYLKLQGIHVDTRTVLDDIKTLSESDLDIEGKRRFYIVNREFDLPELKLLMDSVLTSKFITEKKTEQLINKLARLCSKHEAKEIRGKIYRNRIKSMNEGIHYYVSTIHEAIQNNSSISFKYLQYSLLKDMSFRQNGKAYQVIPIALVYNEDFYYLIASNIWPYKNKDIRHYRVDKMQDVTIIPNSARYNEKNQNEDVDLAQYTKQTFSMYGGRTQKVTIQFDNSLIGVVIDKFGSDTVVSKVNDNHFKITVPVAVSSQFFSWLFAFGDNAKILKPDNVEEEYIKMLKDVLKSYDNKKS